MGGGEGGDWIPPIHCGIAASSSNFQHTHFIPIIVGVGKEGRKLSGPHGETCKEKAAPITGTTLRFTGPVPADSRQ